MEIKELFPFILILILVGMVLGVGILVLDNFGTATKDSTTVTDETNVFAASISTLTNDDVSSITSITNGSTTCTVFNTALWCANWTTAGVVTLNVSTFTNVAETCNVTYVYDADSEATTATTNTISGLATISSTWLPLIVTVAILALILVLVIRSFNMKSR